MSPILIPLLVFAMVVLIVALTHVAGIRTLEIDVQHKLHEAEMDHQRKMQELDLKLVRTRQRSQHRTWQAYGEQ